MHTILKANEMCSSYCGVSYDLCNVLRISYAYLCNVYYVIITSCVLCNTCHAMLSII